MRRAEEKALEVYPVLSLTNDTNAIKRKCFTEGYALAQEDFMEKAEKWFAENIDVMIYPRNAVIENFKKAMSE